MRVCRVFENGAVAICKYNFFKLVFLLIQASKCFVFGRESVAVMFLAAEVSKFGCLHNKIADP